MLEKFIALILFIVTLPLYPFLFLLIRFFSPGPLFFRQKRLGKNKIPFMMYKFRTMVVDADKLKEKYLHFNELPEPLFKMTNDPRHTWIGRILVRTSLDELPQLINIIKGEMAFVGPRPFPIHEAQKIPNKYDARYTVLPGLIGTWVLEGFHNLSLEEWMKVDIMYIKKKSSFYDFIIVNKILLLLVKTQIYRMLYKKKKKIDFLHEKSFK